jgi:hypothetical protein
MEPLPSNDMGIHTQTHGLSFNATRTVQKRRLQQFFNYCLYSLPRERVYKAVA